MRSVAWIGAAMLALWVTAAKLPESAAQPRERAEQAANETAGPSDAPSKRAAAPSDEPARPIAAAELRSGDSFNDASLRSMQADDFRNPGMLSVERGAELWTAKPAGGAKTCADCHGSDAAQSMRGVASRLPAVDPSNGRLTNLAQWIEKCRTTRQGQKPLEYESEDLLGLSAFIAHQSRGMPIATPIDGAAKPFFEAGRALYYRRMGQMNLACTHCHDQNWGKKLLTETISQGHPNAYPIYRLEWQKTGSLHRRFRSCLFGVRAEMWPGGADEYVALELYVNWRARGMSIETPGVRR